jgi:IS5 family transposase
MNRQMSFSQREYAGKKRVTRKEAFLAVMEEVVPWKELVERLEAHYPKGERGRPPMGLERMLRLLVVQNCFGLSDVGVEDAVYDSQAIRGFAGVDISVEDAPDATTVLKFRRWLEEHKLGAAIFDEVKKALGARGLYMKQGTIVDATIISAPSSTKNAEGKRDPEMRSTKKGKVWHFGMKAHIGVDAQSGLVHTVKGTAANEADINQAAELLHGEEASVFGDAGYTGLEKRDEIQAKVPEAKCHIATKPSKIRKMAAGDLRQAHEEYEQSKRQVRAVVEHPFQIIKRRFGFVKVRYRGLRKNVAKLEILFALANLVKAKGWIMSPVPA